MLNPWRLAHEREKDKKIDQLQLYVPVGLLLKYPLTFGGSRNIRIFSQAGIEYSLFIADISGNRDYYDTAMKDLDFPDNYSAAFLDRFSLLAGFGAEFDLSKGRYIRFNGLVDFQIPSITEKDYDDSIRRLGFKLQAAVGFKLGGEVKIQGPRIE